MDTRVLLVFTGIFAASYSTTKDLDLGTIVFANVVSAKQSDFYLFINNIHVMNAVSSLFIHFVFSEVSYLGIASRKIIQTFLSFIVTH